jgi:hypothetical protein
MDTLWFVLPCSLGSVHQLFRQNLVPEVHGIITGRSQIVSTADKISNVAHCFPSSLYFQQLLFIFMCSLFNDVLRNTDFSVPHESFWRSYYITQLPYMCVILCCPQIMHQVLHLRHIHWR